MTQLVISSAGSRTETLLSWITLLSNRKRSFSRQERWVEKEIGWTWTLFAGPLMKRYSQQFSSFKPRTLTWITLFQWEEILRKHGSKLELDEPEPLFHVHWWRDPHDLAVLNSWTWAEWTSASMTQLVISSAGSRTETLLSWITLLSNRKRSFSRQERWVKKKLNEPEPYLHVHWWRDIHNNLAVSISEHWHESHCFLMGRDLRQAWVEIGIGCIWTSFSLSWIEHQFFNQKMSWDKEDLEPQPQFHVHLMKKFLATATI